MNNRDIKLLTLVLPVVVLIFYWSAWLKPFHKERRKIEESLRSLGNTFQLDAQRTQLVAEQQSLRTKVAALSMELPPPETTSTKLPFKARSSLQRLHELCGNSGLRIVAATALPENESQGDSIQRGVYESLQGLDVEAPQHWDITAEAPYSAILQMLETCCTNVAAPVVVESLTLYPVAADQKTSCWRIVLCL